jgi:D-apionolactonase
LDPLAGHGAQALAGFAELQRRVGIPAVLELALPCRDDPSDELNGIAEMIRKCGMKLSALVASPSVDRQSTPPGSKWPDCPPLETVYAAARGAFPGLRLGGGMLSYFTELNRKRVPPVQLDFITHATCPIVHAADDLSVMQSLEALPFITRSVRAIYGDKPYHIGPSTIAMRQNPYGSAAKDNPDLARIPMASRDPRHNGLFAAAWAIGYVARCLAANLEMLTMAGLGGDFGLIAGPDEPMPEGGVRPLFHVVKCLAELSGWQWRECASSDPGRLACVLAEGPDGRRMLIAANLTPRALETDISSAMHERRATIAVLDETGAVAASSGSLAVRPLASNRFALGGFAIVFVRQGAAE